ncbi:MAG: DUF1318 domain-containing protein [Candidatus Brocadia sp. AMX2]|uniref:DUF1318 domain-containing protein n=1 Tax=Candidatus Brocadia sinica JPN1 TaxID=1197129 RepID=A0ABQ0JZM5_9BACT|nr:MULTISPECIES: YdbL family protein [Brocadia]KXK32133.1 MAG: hypothetical protein UZ01_00594 [Candidatus Brocadia sinica]MBC6931511.1 DUF1318 domain-containing protein [Candidatus Brocadia sp.]MBL1169102.1 DUF1318 domain-containing protein [Candidatus Brocadia sp. AMX1]NOG42047.1 YdbL family protein [Planctomycetota bacterium]KAA0244890.1 MAG: DUF1318 domain-containing protein [Candidatus Brocadia sp. AMX2]
MKLKIYVSLLIIMLFGSFFANVSSVADDLSALKRQMEKRLPIIIELKSKGIIGENNTGYLQFIGGRREKEDIVQAENQDRRKVYESIAKKEGASIEQVGQRRAQQIASKARKGEWLQNPTGKWYQK